MSVTINPQEFSKTIERKSKLPRFNRILSHFHKGKYRKYRIPKEIKDDLNEFKEVILELSKNNEIKQKNEKNAIKYIDETIENKEINNEKFRYLQRILDQSHKYYSSKEKEIAKVSEELEDLVPSDWLNEIREAKNEIDNDIKEFKNKDRKGILNDFIQRQSRGRYFSEILFILNSRWDKSFNKNNLKEYIDELEKEGKIASLGGKDTDMYRHYVYQRMKEVYDRKRLDENEVEVEGEVLKEITDYFEKIRAKNFATRIFKFKDINEIDLYIIAKDKLPIGRNLRSLGIYFFDRLGEMVFDKFGYRLREEYRDLESEESMITYLVRRNGDRIYFDEDFVQNSKRLSNLVQS